jgi:hypothetical protein
VSKEFKIFYGKDVKEQLKPLQVFLGQVSPNPASGLVSIPFNLPDISGDMNVRVEVVDMMGRHVETVLNKSLPSGFYSAAWDTSASQTLNGFYIVRLVVNYLDKEQVAATKLIIRK